MSIYRFNFVTILMDQTSMCRRTAPWHGKCCSAFTNRIQENSRKWQYFGCWGSMKTLVEHGLVDRNKGKTTVFSLTSSGLKLGNELFGKPTVDESDSISIIANKTEIQCRASIDIADLLRRTSMEWGAFDIPLGTFWFMKRKKIYDFIIQIVSIGDASKVGVRKKLSAAPFTHKIFFIQSKETQSLSEMKIRLSYEYGIEVVFAESNA